VDINNGSLTGVNLTVGGPVGHTFRIPGIPIVTFNLSFTAQDAWTLSLVDFLLSLTFTDANGLIAGAVYIFDNDNPFIPVVTYSGVTGTIKVTPLPSALPLFGTGLGALGLLGWRRKRKTARIAA
jgi:hypothetical protein